MFETMSMSLHWSIWHHSLTEKFLLISLFSWKERVRKIPLYVCWLGMVNKTKICKMMTLMENHLSLLWQLSLDQPIHKCYIHQMCASEKYLITQFFSVTPTMYSSKHFDWFLHFHGTNMAMMRCLMVSIIFMASA